MEFLSPAKINLFLKVLHKRADGYHELYTWMQAINFFDTLSLHPHTFSQDCLKTQHSTLSTGKDNLVLQASSLFKKITGNTQCFTFYLEKRIPLEAGLGGGSSNAATVLFALNQYFHHPLSQSKLLLLAEKLGADVPFFLSEGSALCRGKGEILTSQRPFLMPKDACLFLPESLKLSTPKVFSCLSAHFLKPLCPPSHLQPLDLLGENDLLPSAKSLSVSLASLADELHHAFDFVAMSGSGPTFFVWGQKRELSLVKGQLLPVQSLMRSINQWYTQPKKEFSCSYHKISPSS